MSKRKNMREGWVYKKLGEVCNIIGRIGFRGYKRTDYVESIDKGAISLSPSNIINGELDYSKNTYITWAKYEESPEIKIYKGDVILVKTASVGKSALVRELPHECTINPQFVVLKDIKLNNECLAYIIKSNRFLLQLKSITSGSSVPTLSQKALAELVIPLPPISIQQSIVAELDEINNLLSLKRKELDTYDKLAQSLFYEMFGDPVETEKGWEMKVWKDVITIINGKNQKDVQCPNGNYPIYGSGGIMGYANAYLCPEGCTIIGRKGNINKPLFVNTKFWNVDTAFGLSPNMVKLVPYYLFYFCLNYNFEIHNKAVTIPSLTKADLLKIKIPLPPLPLQQLFASRIEAIEEQKKQVKAAIEKLETLLASRMQYWFD